MLSNLRPVWSDASMLHIRSGWFSVALASPGLGLVIQSAIVSILKVFKNIFFSFEKVWSLSLSAQLFSPFKKKIQNF